MKPNYFVNSHPLYKNGLSFTFVSTYYNIDEMKENLFTEITIVLFVLFTSSYLLHVNFFSGTKTTTENTAQTTNSSEQNEENFDKLDSSDSSDETAISDTEIDQLDQETEEIIEIGVGTEYFSDNEDDTDENYIDDKLYPEDEHECEEFNASLNTSSSDQSYNLSLMKKCRQLISMIKKSNILNEYITKKRMAHNINRTLTHDIPCRWNSTFFMIDSLLCLRAVIDKLYNEKHQLKLKPSMIKKINQLEINSTEWSHLEQLHEILKLFYQGTIVMSGRKYPTIGVAYFVVRKLQNYLENNSNDNQILKRLKGLLRSTLARYFDTDNEQLNLLKVIHHIFVVFVI